MWLLRESRFGMSIRGVLFVSLLAMLQDGPQHIYTPLAVRLLRG